MFPVTVSFCLTSDCSENNSITKDLKIVPNFAMDHGNSKQLELPDKGRDYQS